MPILIRLSGWKKPIIGNQFWFLQAVSSWNMQMILTASYLQLAHIFFTKSAKNSDFKKTKQKITVLYDVAKTFARLTYKATFYPFKELTIKNHNTAMHVIVAGAINAEKPLLPNV
jgi:hypothetical protein